MDGGRALEISDGEALPADFDTGETAIAELVHKTVVAPTALSPSDLDTVRGSYGLRGALEITAYIASFHFINRIADLVGIQSDLPMVQPRFAWLRRLGVRFQGWSMGKMADLSLRSVDDQVDVEEKLRALAAHETPPSGYDALRAAPNVAAYAAEMAATARRVPREMMERVTRGVAEALPTEESEAVGFHPRPADPFDALVFVGTRYASRTTKGMVDAVREKDGYGDPELTDLFFAIAFRNGVERMNRLLDGFV